MPDVDFRITGVEPAVRGLTPLLHFKVEVSNAPETEVIHSILLQAQVQIQCPQRSYSAKEKEKLIDLFGTPERWGQTLRNRLWTQAHTTVRPFSGKTDALLPILCTYDLNVAATKYFHALGGGEVPLLFLFSGTIFYAAADERLQVRQISWNKECEFRMPIELWHGLMEHHYPNSAWLYLRRDIFERLYAYKCQHGLPTWEETIERLLPEAAGREAAS